MRREADPADRRRLALVPTEAVAEREAEIFADLVLETQEIIATYDSSELATILDFLRGIGEATARDADRLAADQPPS